VRVEVEGLANTTWKPPNWAAPPWGGQYTLQKEQQIPVLLLLKKKQQIPAGGVLYFVFTTQVNHQVKD
jgi:hypothetical protein